jgi:hypothetical protein
MLALLYAQTLTRECIAEKFIPAMKDKSIMVRCTRVKSALHNTTFSMAIRDQTHRLGVNGSVPASES